MHVEHKDFTMWEEYTVASKFRGKYLVCYPIGNTHIVFHRSGNHYTWNKIVTTIHNIIFGKLWIDCVCVCVCVCVCERNSLFVCVCV